MIVVLLTAWTRIAMASTVTIAPGRNPVPLIVTSVGRAVEPVEGEIAVTVGAGGAPGAADGSGVGPDGDLPSQAVSAIANVNSKTPRWVLFVMASFPLNQESGKAP